MHDVLMAMGAIAGCHQLPERSFFFKGYQFPLCARCTGILIGQLLALPLWLFYRPTLLTSLVLIIPMACDGGLQYVFSVMSNNLRRVVTGLLAGCGYTSVGLHLLLLFAEWVKTIL